MKVDLKITVNSMSNSITKCFIVLWLLSAGLLTGCATTDLQSETVREVNGQKVTAVERVAKDAGVHIIWINPPTTVRERKLTYSMKIKAKRKNE